MKKKYIKIFIIIALIVIVCLVIFSSCSISLQDTFSFAHTELHVGESIYQSEEYLNYPYGEEFKKRLSKVNIDKNKVFVADFNCQLYKSDFSNKIIYAFYVLKLKYNPQDIKIKDQLLSSFSFEEYDTIEYANMVFHEQKTDDENDIIKLYLAVDNGTAYILFTSGAIFWKCSIMPDIGNICFVEKNGVARVDYEGKSFITPY